MSAYDLFRDSNGDFDGRRYEKMLAAIQDDELTDDALIVIEETYKSYEIPPCRQCGKELTIGDTGGGRRTKYHCGKITISDEDFSQHMEASWWEAPNRPDSLVMLLLEKHREAVSNQIAWDEYQVGINARYDKGFNANGKRIL